MKSLQTIQKTSKVFQTLSLIATVVSFLWAACSLLGLVCFAAWGERFTLAGQEVLSAMGEESLRGAVCALLSDAAFALTDGVLFLMTWRYLKSELADGTPFTRAGTVKIRHLGISTIVMPNVAVIVSAILYAALSVEPVRDWSTASSTLLGVALILASLVFRYGAELEERGERA